MKGRGTTDAIFILRQMQEKVLEGNNKRYWTFVDLEKAFDRLPRESQEEGSNGEDCAISKVHVRWSTHFGEVQGRGHGGI